MELVLVTLTILPKKDPKEKVDVSTTAANTQLPKDLKDTKDKLVIKMKKIDCFPSLFYFYFNFLVL